MYAKDKQTMTMRLTISSQEYIVSNCTKQLARNNYVILEGFQDHLYNLNNQTFASAL